MSRWPGKYVIGLTGNIAVGKSVVRQMTQHLGAYTIDADGLGHQAMSPGAPAYKPIIATFGQFILDDEKRINRAMLGNIVFSNKEAMEKLEKITHPIIRQAINALVSRSKQKVIVVEAIKLLEGELADMVDEVWVVNAKPETQYKRLVGKRKMSPDDAKKRILAQGPQGEKLSKADVVIQNDGNIEETWLQVQDGWNKIKEKLTASAPPPAPAQPQATAKPAQPAVQSVAKAQPTPQPAAAPVDDDDDTVEPTQLDIDTSGVEVKRGMPGNAEGIANFINKHSGQTLSRMDVMMAFGQKSYLLSEDGSETINGLMGWQVENLITRVDEFYVDQGGNRQGVIHSLIHAVEAASKELQSEVGFIFLSTDTPQDIIKVFLANGYEITGIKEIKIPAWRESVRELAVDGIQILQKPLRKDRVLKPI